MPVRPWRGAAASVLAAGLALGGLAPRAPVAAQEPAPTPAIGAFGLDTGAMDLSVRPGDDFYRYVNGGWLKAAVIPADRASYGVFDGLVEKADADVRAIVDDIARAPGAAGSVRRKVSDLYASWMDQARIEARGIEPLRADLAAIAAARTTRDLVRLMARVEHGGPFALAIQADPADPTRYVVAVTQAGLGMPVRDHYLSDGATFDGYRAAYRAYVTRIFELLGDPTPGESAAAVIALETKLARVHWTLSQRRDVKATTNPADRAGLARMIPAVDWTAALEAGDLAGARRFLVRETTALRDGAALLDSEPVDTWRRYLTFHLANRNASLLPQAFDEASFAFHERALHGVEVQRERWKRGIALLNQHLGEGLGELYVARHFPPGHKAAMDALVANLRAAFAERLRASTWMDDTTRAAALEKLAAFEPRVGHPSRWRDYSALPIDRATAFENVRHAQRFDWSRQVARLDGPVDRGEWVMNPQTVNAYHNATMNQITFPAAILQPPFFDPHADPAVNYGAIGAVIGHELGHGFDDRGREHDATGRVRNWWTAQTAARFVAQADRLAAQYDAYCPLPGACVNGKLTSGENIGDLGGLEMAYTAYRLSLNGGEAPVLGGFTGDQRFFMAFAQASRGVMRDDALRTQLLSDPHPPEQARGWLPLRNIDAWYAAFGVKPGDKGFIAPEQRVRIW